MRIFIAIDFDKNTKLYLEDFKTKLENYCVKGRFTSLENFHMTLQFIGETNESDIQKVIKAVAECVLKYEVFNLTLDRLGRFRKGDLNLLWIGIDHNEILPKIYEELCLALKREKISFDEKPLKPHITLGRQILLKKDINELSNLLAIDKLIIPVNNITLMESKQVNGKLTYIPLELFPLKS